jgi:uncharacterized protein YbjT (DUF2867 family)
MRVILFGATGMIGQGVLRECLRDPGVEHVLAVSRRPGLDPHAKLRELVHADFTDFGSIAPALAGFDACFFCLGVSAAGMSEAAYQRVTFDVTMAVARVLAASSPWVTFVYVSGAGADSTEQGRIMWARVKGRTENALRTLPLRAVYIFRPGYIQPLHGITSRTRLYRLLYVVVAPLYPLWRRLFPALVTTTEEIGLAMLHVARHGYTVAILESREIAAAALGPGPDTPTS